MAKILVVYDSRSGNTEALASAVAKGAESTGDVEVTVKKAEQTKPTDLLAADGIIMGSPTYFGQMSAKLKFLIDQSVQVHKQLEGKVGGRLHKQRRNRFRSRNHPALYSELNVDSWDDRAGQSRRCPLRGCSYGCAQ